MARNAFYWATPCRDAMLAGRYQVIACRPVVGPLHQLILPVGWQCISPVPDPEPDADSIVLSAFSEEVGRDDAATGLVLAFPLLKAFFASEIAGALAAQHGVAMSEVSPAGSIDLRATLRGPERFGHIAIGHDEERWVSFLVLGHTSREAELRNAVGIAGATFLLGAMEVDL